MPPDSLSVTHVIVNVVAIGSLKFDTRGTNHLHFKVYPF